MKLYRFYFTDNYGNGDERAETSEQWISDKTDPKKYGFELAKNRVYGKKQSYNMFGTPRRFFDSTFTGFKLLDENFDEAKKKFFKEREEQNEAAARKLKREVEKMDFDYYQIKGKWNAATVSRRAEKLDEAERAADELEEAGAVGVDIVGVKAGKRETLRGKRTKKAAKPAGGTNTPAKKKKAYAAPKMTISEQEKPKPKKSATKKKPKREKPAPAKKIDETAAALERYRVKGSDDPFYNNDSWDRYDLEGDEKFLFSLTPDDLNYLNNALQRFEIPPETWDMVINTDQLETTISNLRYEQKPVDLEFTGYEMAYILRALDNLLEKQKTTFFKNDIEALILDFSR